MDSFDILFRDFFNTTDNTFGTLTNTVSRVHPVDIYETEETLSIEVACVGLTKDDVDVTLEDACVHISYNKQTNTDTRKTLYRGIKRSSFNLGYKISAKYDVTKATAKLENGLLVVTIPVAKNKIKKLSIQ